MGKYIISKNSQGYTFSLKADNGEIIGTSGEVITTLDNIKKSIESVRKNAPVAAVEDQTVDGYAVEKNPKFEIYLDKKGEFRFRLKASNGEKILASEGYTTKANCKKGIESVVKNAPSATVEGPEGV